MVPAGPLRRRQLRLILLIVMLISLIAAFGSGLTLPFMGDPEDSPDYGVAKCDGDLMSPGDECLLVSEPDSGVLERYSYDEMVEKSKDDARLEHEATVVVFAVALPVSLISLALWLVYEVPPRRRWRRDPLVPLARRRGWTIGGPDPDVAGNGLSGRPIGVIAGESYGWCFEVERYERVTWFHVLFLDGPGSQVNINIDSAGNLSFVGDAGLGRRLMTEPVRQVAVQYGITNFSVSPDRVTNGRSGSWEWTSEADVEAVLAGVTALVSAMRTP
ncbi:hypothetical protein [Actinomadura meridiana]